MRVLGKKKLVEFAQRHGDVRSQIDAWVCEAEEAEWRTPSDIKKRYASASFLARNRVVFNLKGNTYRLDAKIAYQTQIVVVKRVGTHAEYDNWQF